MLKINNMDLISYLQNTINSTKGKRPKSNLLYDEKDSVDKKTTTEKTLKTFFPKETNWLNWNDKGFKNALLDAQIHTESRGNSNAVSPAGAKGLAQFMDITWKDAKNKGWIDENADRSDPEASLKAQKELMDYLYNRPEMKESESEEERYAKTLAAYNAGYGSLRNAITKADVSGSNWLNYMPSETRKYIPQIMNKTKEEYFKTEENYVPKYNRD